MGRGVGLRAILLLGCLWATACSDPPPIPRYDHVVIVIEENHSFDSIFMEGKRDCCPYINGLAQSGALMTQSYAVTHPSLPNYLVLFSGSTQGVTDDGCDYSFSGPHLAARLREAGLTFAGYSEGIASQGSTACNAGGKSGYFKKHVPWAYWQEAGAFPAALSRSFDEFPRGPDYASLPTISFVIPNAAHDMHEPEGYPPAADKWLEENLDRYRRWAESHNSVLIVTWDEDDLGRDNHIPTIFTGARVKPGRYGRKVTHYDLLRTLEEMYGLKPLAESSKARPIREVFR